MIFIAGLFVGGCVGFMAAALCSMAAWSDRRDSDD